MREIKFRAWDKAYGGYVQSGIQFNNTTMRLEAVGGLILEQYTGMNDRNGEDIYEGDVVRRANDTWQIIWQIIWEKDCWGAYRKGENLMDWWDEFEVVGNIHANPELIGEVK